MEIEFNAELHEYRWDGRRVPSVTEVLSMLTDWSGVPPALMAAARDLGSHVHEATHLHDIGNLNRWTLDPVLDGYLRGWERFLEETGAVVVASEQPVYHPKLKYAGTPDRVLWWKDRFVVPDLKSTAAVPTTVGAQTAAYTEAYCEMFKPSKKPLRYCIQLNPDGTYKSIRRDDPADWSLFLSALNVHNFKEKHGVK